MVQSASDFLKNYKQENTNTGTASAVLPTGNTTGFQTAADFLKQQGQTIKPVEKKKSFIQSAGDFLLSSEKNFGQDIGQAGYLMFGGQKKIDTITQQYMDNGNKLVDLAKKQTDKNRKAQLLKQAEENFTEAQKVGGSILGDVRTPKQIIADAVGVAADVLTAGTYTKAGMVGSKAMTTGLQKGVPTVLKGVIRETVKKGGKQAVKKSGKEIAKTILKDSLIGSSYGLISTAQEKDATAKDYLVNAGIGAIAGAVIPPVLGASLKGAFKGTKFIAGKSGQLAEKTAMGLEKFATREAGNTGSRFYENVYNKAPSILKKTAEVTAGVIRAGQKLPDQLAAQFLDKYHTLGNFMAKAKKLGVETPDLKDMAQATKYRATGKAENKLDDYLNLRQIYKDDWATIKEYSHYLDDLDRLANDNKIAGGRTAENVASDMAKLSDLIPPEKMAKIKDGQKELQSFLNNELIDAVDSGRLSPEQYKAIKAKHPNYVPHDVLDYLDEEGLAKSTGLGGAINVSKSGIEGAKGSIRAIDDIDNSITRRLYRQNILNEKNKTVKAVIDVGKQMGEEGGFKPLRTEENVKKRIEILTNIKNINKELKPNFRALRQTFKADRETLSIIDSLEKQVNELSEKRIEEFNSFLNEGQKITKEVAQRGVKTGFPLAEKLPKDLFDIAQDIKKGDFYDILKLEKLFNDGLLERNGFNSVKQFVDYIKQPAKIIPSKTIEAKLGGSIPKIIQLQKNIEKIIPKIESSKNIDKISINDSFIFLENTINDLNQNKELFKSQLPEVLDIKIKGVDIPPGFEKIQYFNNGVREDWLVPDDVGRALKNLDGEEAGKVMSWLNNSFMGKVVSAPANVLRKVATVANPVFALFRNPVRDMQTAILTATDDYSKGLIKTITGKSDDALYKLARESGALQGSIYREQLKPEQIIQQKISEKTGLLKKLVTRPDRLIEEYGQKLEEFTRMSVFSGALKNGKTTQEAAKLARNATVDFGKSGNTIQVLNKVIPFLNARIQGFSNMGKAIVADPTKATRVLMWSAAYPQAVLTAYNSKYSSYSGIPDYEKRKYWIVMVGENKGKDLDGKSVMIPNYVKIPKGEAQQAVSNVIERTLTLANQKYPDSTAEFLGKLIGDISPVTDSSIIPTGLQQVIELKTNYSFYKDKQIESDWTKKGNKWFESKNVDPKYKTNLNTSELAKQIGGFLNWSPIKIDYVIKTGVIGDIVNAYDLLPWPKDKEQIKEDERKTPFEKVSELPIISGVVGSAYWAEQQAKKKADTEKLKENNNKKIQRILK